MVDAFWLPMIAGALVLGTMLGMVVGRWWYRRHPYDPHHVPRRCLERGHKWRRQPVELPIQFCARLKCGGARVTPAAVEGLPAGLVAALRATLAEDGALSLDEAP